MKKKVIDFLLGLLPISRKKYTKDMLTIVTALQGLSQAESQISQIQMTILQNLEQAKLNKAKRATKKKMTDDIALG